MFFAALTPLLPHYADHFDLSKTGAGVLAAAYPAGVLVGSLPSGLASTWFGARAVVIGGLLLLAATTVAFGLGESVVVLDAARFTQGLASSCAWTAGLSWLVSAAPASRRGELLGSAMAAAIVGALFGPVLGGASSLLGAGVVFGAVGAVTLGLAVWAALTPPPGPPRRQPLAMFGRAVLDHRVARAFWFVMLPALLFGTLNVLAPLRLSDLGVGAVAIASVYLLSAGLEALASPMLGRLSDRIGRLRPIRAGLLASAAVAAVLPWPDRALPLAAVVVCAGLAFGSFWTPAMSLLADEAERRGLDYAYAFALINLAWAPGQALGSSGGGALAELTVDAVPYLLLSTTCLVTFAALARGQVIQPSLNE